MPDGNAVGCIQVFFQASVCWYPGFPTCYVAGKQKIVLTGNIPSDRTWDKKWMILHGRLVENNNCTMFFVESATPCATPTK